MNKEKLKERCYEMGNSKLPVDVFYNDIRDNKAPNFNKEEAYADLEKIVDYIEMLEKENQKLKERYKHRAETSNDLCKAVKQYEKAIEILKDRFEIVEVKEDYDGEYIIETSTYFLYITKEQYELLKEIL